MEETSFKPWWTSKAVWSGVLAAIAGILQTSYAFILDPGTQEQIINVAFGLVTVLAGGGSIYGRIVAAVPIATRAAKLIAKLKADLRAREEALQRMTGGVAG